MSSIDKAVYKETAIAYNIKIKALQKEKLEKEKLEKEKEIIEEI